MSGHKVTAAEVARDVTIAYKEKIKWTDTQSADSMNVSLAIEAAKFYETIYKKVIELTDGE